MMCLIAMQGETELLAFARICVLSLVLVKEGATKVPSQNGRGRNNTKTAGATQQVRNLTAILRLYDAVSLLDGQNG